MNFPMTVCVSFHAHDEINQYYDSMGLWNSHVYAILDTRVAGSHLLVLIGNDSEWKGSYSEYPTFESEHTDDFNHPDMERLKKRRLTWIGIVELSKFFQILTVCKHREGWFRMKTKKFSGSANYYAGGLRIRVKKRCQLTIERTECGTSEEQYIGFINIHKTNQNNDIGPIVKSFRTEMKCEDRTVDIDPFELESGYYMIVYISAHRHPSLDYYWIFRSPTSMEHFSAVPVNYDYLTVRDLSLLEMMKGTAEKEIEKGVFLREHSDGNVMVLVAENKTEENIAIRVVAKPVAGFRFLDINPTKPTSCPKQKPLIAHSETINMETTLSPEKSLFHVPANSAKVLGLICQETNILLCNKPPLKCLFKINIYKGKEIEELEKQHPSVGKDEKIE